MINRFCHVVCSAADLVGVLVTSLKDFGGQLDHHVERI